MMMQQNPIKSNNHVYMVFTTNLCYFCNNLIIKAYEDIFYNFTRLAKGRVINTHQDQKASSDTKNAVFAILHRLYSSKLCRQMSANVGFVFTICLHDQFNYNQLTI